MRLILHDILGIFSAVVIMTLGFFVLRKDYRKTVNVTLGLIFFRSDHSPDHERHRRKRRRSEGENKGSTFSFKLPMAK